MPILEGGQGKGKSTFINTLARDWFSELPNDIADQKEMVASMQGSWIIEVPELSLMARADVNDLKAFVTRRVDKTRLPYERRAAEFPRQCIFMGSTNDKEYLRDRTGGRRFWPIECDPGIDIDNKRLDAAIGQIWGEAYALYAELRRLNPAGSLPLYMTGEAAEEAALMQESRRVEAAEDTLAGRIQAWLERPIGTDSGFDDLDADAPKIYRTETCIAEIWEEVENGKGMVQHREAMSIGKSMSLLKGWTRTIGPVSTKKWGRVRVYRMVGSNEG